jgi:hypothetical protein
MTLNQNRKGQQGRITNISARGRNVVQMVSLVTVVTFRSRLCAP